MALDNAQFMSELSITDPPGTDPLSEGDDQIRTSKRTQLQSFPNVDKAVTTTADELNDVALQSAANVFSAATNQFNNMALRYTAIANTNDTGCLFISDIATLRWDIRRVASLTSGDLTINRYDANGNFQDVPFVIDAANGRASFLNIATFNGGVRVLDGSATTPSYAFNTSPSTGFYKPSSGVLAWGISGAEMFRISTSAMTMIAIPAIRSLNGTASTPSYTFSSQTDLGMFRIGSSALGFSAAATLRLHVKSNTLNFPNLPTTNAGLISGDIFRSGGFIAIVA